MPNREDISKFYDFLNHGVTEVRIISPPTQERTDSRALAMRHFDDREKFIEFCMEWHGRGNIYAGINPRPDRFLGTRESASDSDIEYVTAIVLDVDAERPEGRYVPSTKEEMDGAISRARDIAEYLVEKGICAAGQPQIIMSGSGCHMLLPMPAIEVTDMDELKARLRIFGKELRAEFEDDKVSVNTIQSLQHVTKVAGVLSLREDNTPDRPHRVAYPLTDLERRESGELWDYILNLEIETGKIAPPFTLPPPPDIELPTDLDDVPPCNLCEGAIGLWNATSVDDVSMAEFRMMNVLVAKGMTRADAIAYIQKYDRRIQKSSTGRDSKYTSREDCGLREINSMYSNVTSATIPCQWLREHGYCQKSASECDDECRGGPKYRPTQVSAEEVEWDTISLDEARGQLQGEISKIEVRTGPRTHLITYPSGVGKTHEMAEHVRIRGWKVLWMCATHRHAQETRLKHFQGMDVVELSSRSKMIEDGILDCPRRKDIKRVSEVSPESTAQVCRECYRKMNRTCEYYSNLEDAKDADIVIGMHAHLQLPEFLRKYMDDVDCIVINEDASSYYRRECTFTTSDVEASISLLEEIRDSTIVSEEVSDTAAELIEYHRDFLDRDDEKFRLPPLPSISADFREIYDVKFLSGRSIWVNDDATLRSITAQLPEPKENVLRVFLHASQDASMSITRDGDGYTYIRSVELPDDMDVVMLDATGRKVTYEAMLGREVVVYGEDCYLEQVIHVTQFLDGTYPSSSLMRNDQRTTSYHRVKTLVDTIVEKHKRKRILIAATKKVEALMTANGILDNPGTQIDMVHYYDMRGLDEYGDYDVLIVVGHPMISFEDIASQARILYDQEWDDEVMVQQMLMDGKEYKLARYSVDGMGYEVETYRFSNPVIQRYYESIVEAEVIQMIGRIRPYAGTVKNVYLINSTPLLNLKVDRLITIDDFMSGEGRAPTARRVRSEVRVHLQEVIDKLADEFTTEEVGEAMGRDSQSQLDDLRRLMSKHQEYLRIVVEPRKKIIRKRP